MKTSIKLLAVLALALLPVTAASANGGRGIAQSTPPPPSILRFDLETGMVSGTTCASCIVEIFSDSGDEGAIFEGWILADTDGLFTFIKGAPLAGPFLTATATDPGGSTSEFSHPSQVN